ncbi:MAG: TrkA C-terminal domain-containing protein [Candidatus Bathyarchaeia archaeon]
MRSRMRKEKIRYQPISVKEILLEMKNLSELMIDLAYSAALFGDRDLAEDVIELEERIDTLAYLLDIEMMLAARDAEDAKVLSGVAKVASATDKISDAAGDIANIVLQGIGVHPVIAEIFERVEERLAKVKILENSPVVGIKIGSIDPASMGIDIIAIRRGGDWIINPREDETIRGGDIIIVRGVQDGINGFRERVGEKIVRGEEEIIRKIVWEDRFRNVIERFVELKDVSELMIDLAYSALLLNSKELAEEVHKLEEYVDKLHTEFELMVLSSGFVESEAKGILGLIRLGVAAESISDAAAEIAEIILRGIEPHPVLKIAVESAEETVVYVRVKWDSALVGKTLREARIPEETGMWVLAIKRGDKLVRPKPEMRIEADDVIIAAGYSQGKEDLLNLVSKTKS